MNYIGTVIVFIELTKRLKLHLSGDLVDSGFESQDKMATNEQNLQDTIKLKFLLEALNSLSIKPKEV